MNFFIKNLFYFISLACLFIGYCLAIISFKCNIWLEIPDNRYYINYSMFFYSKRHEYPPILFSRYYKPNKNDKTKITQSFDYLRTLNLLNSLDKSYLLSLEQKKYISSNFYYIAKNAQNMNVSDNFRYISELLIRFDEDEINLSTNHIDVSIPDEILQRINKIKTTNPQGE